MTDGQEDRMPLCVLTRRWGARGGRGGGDRRRGWLSGLAIDRDEKALRGGGGGGGGGVRRRVFGRCPVSPGLGPSPSLSEPNRKWQQPQHSRRFSLFYARMQISLACHPCGEVVRTDDAQTGASLRTHAYTRSHTPLVVLHAHAMSSA